MTSSDATLLRRRLRSQLLTGRGAASPREVVSHLGAVQAQDYLAFLWAAGCRIQGAVEADVERAVAAREVVRCWPMRGTLHVVAAEDVRWMLELLAPRALERHRTRLERHFGLDRAALRGCRTVVERSLRDGTALTRGELYARLEHGGIATTNGRALQIVFALAHERLICFGPRRGKQPTFVLLDEWVPPSPPKEREEALAELARRYQRGHGPATVHDLVWWSGLTVKEAREAMALAGEVADDGPPPRLASPFVRLLPAFDEYTVGYRDRSAMLDPAHAKKVNAGGGMLNPVLVIDGRVEGTWKRTPLTVTAFRALTERASRAVERELARFRRFTGG